MNDFGARYAAGTLGEDQACQAVDRCAQFGAFTSSRNLPPVERPTMCNALLLRSPSKEGESYMTKPRRVRCRLLVLAMAVIFQTTTTLAAAERILTIEVTNEGTLTTVAKITSLHKGILINRIVINEGEGGCSLWGYTERYLNAFGPNPDMRKAFYELKYPIPMAFGEVMYVSALNARTPFFKMALGIMQKKCVIEFLKVEVDTNYGDVTYYTK